MKCLAWARCYAGCFNMCCPICFSSQTYFYTTSMLSLPSAFHRRGTFQFKIAIEEDPELAFPDRCTESTDICEIISSRGKKLAKKLLQIEWIREKKALKQWGEAEGNLAIDPSPSVVNHFRGSLYSRAFPWGAKSLNPTSGTTTFKTCTWEMNPPNFQLWKASRFASTRPTCL